MVNKTSAKEKKKQVKIAVFIPSLHGGGAEKVMLQLAEEFAVRNYTTHVILSRAEGNYLSNLPKSVRIIDLNASRVLFSLTSLVQYLRNERPDVLLSAMGHANIIALWARWIAKVPTRVVISEHSILSLSVQKSNSWRGRFIPFLMRFFYSWSYSIVAVSQGVADDLACFVKLPRERINVIYNPIFSDELQKKAQESINHPWFLRVDSPIILGVGRLTRVKDFSTLIRAFALVRKERPARLLILGEGEKRKELEELIKKKGIVNDVHMPGFVDNPFAYMKRSSVFVLSSKWEGFGNVLVEAMACGCPVVSTNCPVGPSEILRCGHYGPLVPVGDEKKMADAIIHILDGPRNSSILQNRAKLFSVKAAVDGYLDAMLVSRSLKVKAHHLKAKKNCCDVIS